MFGLLISYCFRVPDLTDVTFAVRRSPERAHSEITSEYIRERNLTSARSALKSGPPTVTWRYGILSTLSSAYLICIFIAHFDSLLARRFEWEISNIRLREKWSTGGFDYRWYCIKGWLDWWRLIKITCQQFAFRQRQHAPALLSEDYCSR